MKSRQNLKESSKLIFLCAHNPCFLILGNIILCYQKYCAYWIFQRSRTHEIYCTFPLLTCFAAYCKDQRHTMCIIFTNMGMCSIHLWHLTYTIVIIYAFLYGIRHLSGVLLLKTSIIKNIYKYRNTKIYKYKYIQ